MALERNNHTQQQLEYFQQPTFAREKLQVETCDARREEKNSILYEGREKCRRIVLLFSHFCDFCLLTSANATAAHFYPEPTVDLLMRRYGNDGWHALRLNYY
jgi:hypothetical protein